LKKAVQKKQVMQKNRHDMIKQDILVSPVWGSRLYWYCDERTIVHVPLASREWKKSL